MTESTDGLDGWEIVIGLEVHCELATKTKLFCGCANMFGDEPNTNVCPVCLGLPGSLPVLNEKAVELALRLGQALHCTAKPGVFARKNYFYPDMPKDYQISQYDQPTNVDGWLDLPSGVRIGIERAHIEEDTGKNTHVGGDGRIHGAEYSLIDYNRAGVPLVEIVSRPDLRGSEQAREYVGELRDILLATDVSRRADGGGIDAGRRERVRAARRRQRARHAVRDQEPQLACARSAAPSSTRRGARSISSGRASACGRRRATGTKAPVARAAGAARKRPRTTATSKSRTSFRSSPKTTCIARPRRHDAAVARRPARPPRGGDRRGADRPRAS